MPSDAVVYIGASLPRMDHQAPRAGFDAVHGSCLIHYPNFAIVRSGRDAPSAAIIATIAQRHYGTHMVLSRHSATDTSLVHSPGEDA